MGPDVKLMLTFGTLHLIAVALGAGLFVMFLRSETTDPWQPPDDDDGGGGGGNDRLPGRPKSSPPFGGVPLPDAVQSSVRLRGPGRLRDLRPQRERRPAREPPRAPQRGAPPGARAGAAAPPRPALAVLLRARVVAAEVLPRRLAVERAVGQQALLVQRRRGARVAALPARADPELVEGPVDRSAQPRLLRVDPEVVVDEVLLEGPRALLLGRARAVRLGAELRDDDGVVRIAVAHLVEVARELRAVEDGAARAGIPAEVVVDADDVERAVGLLAAR